MQNIDGDKILRPVVRILRLQDTGAGKCDLFLPHIENYRTTLYRRDSTPKARTDQKILYDQSLMTLLQVSFTEKRINKMAEERRTREVSYFDWCASRNRKIDREKLNSNVHVHTGTSRGTYKMKTEESYNSYPLVWRRKKKMTKIL